MQPLRGNLAPLTLASKAPVLAWLTGGIAAANCIGAYHAKGAASLVASYTNLANPGTYTAAPGTAPTWDAINGWKFAAASLQYLTTGIVPGSTQNWSMLIRFSNGTTSANSYLAGSRIATNRFFLNHSDGAGAHAYGNGGNLTVATAKAAGVMALVGAAGYLDGNSEGAIAAGSGTINQGIAIGALNNNGSIAGHATVYIQVVWIYNISILAYIGGLTTAANAI